MRFSPTGPLAFAEQSTPPPSRASFQYRPTVEDDAPQSWAAISRIGMFAFSWNHCSFRRSGHSASPPFPRPTHSFSLWYTLHIRRFSVAVASMRALAPFSSAQYGRAGASERLLFALVGKGVQKATFPTTKSSSVTSTELSDLRKIKNDPKSK